MHSSTMKRIISFDLDGTLVTTEYVDAVWLERIPEIYAETHALSFEEARNIVEREYLKIGPEALEWYNIHYWLEKFDLDIAWNDVLESCIDRVATYPEVPEVLEALGTRHTLIIISNAAREFIQKEMGVLDIGKHFSAIFSSVSDFGKTKKEKSVYEMVCERMGIEKSAMIHVGDNYLFDYAAPREARIEAYYLDRDGTHADEDHVVRNLKDFEKRITGL